MTQLRITGRCQREDLTSPSLRPVAHLLIEKFHELRGQAPDGGEGISGLRDRPCKSLHASHYRGITWYDQQHDVVWLLAAHIHREGSHDDSYFRGKVVNKAHTINTGVDEFPRYVVEYLIDNYCAEETFHQDMEKVVRRLCEAYVYGPSRCRPRKAMAAGSLPGTMSGVMAACSGECRSNAKGIWRE